MWKPKIKKISNSDSDSNQISQKSEEIIYVCDCKIKKDKNN